MAKREYIIEKDGKWLVCGEKTDSPKWSDEFPDGRLFATREARRYAKQHIAHAYLAESWGTDVIVELT